MVSSDTIEGKKGKSIETGSTDQLKTLRPGLQVEPKHLKNGLHWKILKSEITWNSIIKPGDESKHEGL